MGRENTYTVSFVKHYLIHNESIWYSWYNTDFILGGLKPDCSYEHPAHSLDVLDKIWADYFTTDELEGIMNTNNVSLPQQLH